MKTETSRLLRKTEMPVELGNAESQAMSPGLQAMSQIEHLQPSLQRRIG